MNPPYILTDTHTHFYYNVHTDKIDKQMRRCQANHIYRLFLPNVDTVSIQQVLDTVDTYPENCFPMLGLHPCSVKENYKDELRNIEKAISSHKIYAIGEIGLDLYWDKSTLSWQKDAFCTQVQWAKELGLPIDIHCREAFDEIFDLLDSLRDEKLFGIFHCFTGNLDQAHRAIDLGFKLGIGGVVTFKKSGLDDVVRQINLTDIVLETDAPYLAPTPFRGKENESSYLHHIAQKVADIYDNSIDEIARITTENSKDIFGI
jgi:TatD DNase family protein